MTKVALLKAAFVIPPYLSLPKMGLIPQLLISRHLDKKSRKNVLSLPTYRLLNVAIFYLEGAFSTVHINEAVYAPASGTSALLPTTSAIFSSV